MAKILIVEDEQVLAEMYRDKFQEAGYAAEIAFSVKEALQSLKKEKPDLILLDILLPLENGLSLLNKIKKTATTAHIPVVAFSNYDDPKTKKEAFGLGVKDYLIKTQYTPQELLAEIKKYLKGAMVNRGQIRLPA